VDAEASTWSLGLQLRDEIFDADHRGLFFAKRKMITAYPNVNGIAKRSDTLDPERRPRHQTHVHKPLVEFAGAAYAQELRALSYF
jgi:hypothetical protein